MILTSPAFSNILLEDYKSLDTDYSTSKTKDRVTILFQEYFDFLVERFGDKLDENSDVYNELMKELKFENYDYETENESHKESR